MSISDFVWKDDCGTACWLTENVAIQADTLGGEKHGQPKAVEFLIQVHF